MEIKKRFKLYKSGKNWCMAALMFAGASAGIFMNNVSANADDATATNQNADANKSTTVTTVNDDIKTNEVSLKATNQTTDSKDKSVATTTNDTTLVSNDDKNATVISTKNGEVSENGAKYYYENGQMKKNFFRTDDKGNVFYYGTDGKMYQGQFYQNWGNTYYFGNDGARYTNEWYENWGNKYRFGNDGALLKGLNLVDGSVYWFDRVNGVMYKDKFYQNWGNTYYFGDDGKRYTNQWYENWGNKYYFGSDGALLKNNFLTAQDGKVFYFDQDGVMYQNKFYQNWGKMYYFGADGARYTNQWYENWGNKYYFGSDGALLKDQFLTDNGKVYYFDQDGVMYRNKFYQNWGKTYYFGADGARYTNQWYENWGNKYYFGNDGALLKDQFLTENGRVYYFGAKDGVMTRNKFYQNWGKTYYFGADGARYTNRFYTNWGNVYFYGDDGSLKKDTSFSVDGNLYRANKDGVVADLDGNKLTQLPTSQSELKMQLSELVTSQLGMSFATDWADHVAKLISQDEIKNETADIEKYVHDNEKISGKVIKSQVINFAKGTSDVKAISNKFLDSLSKDQRKNAFVGVGVDQNSNKLDILLFRSATNQLVNVNNKTYYYDQDGNMVKNQTVYVNDIPYSFDQNGELKTGLVTDGDKVYYLDGTIGGPRKNYLYRQGTTTYYFDSVTGQGLNTLESEWNAGQVSSNKKFADGNEAYSFDGDSIQNIDGFLTANTWYRPKQILKNGTTWVDSQSTDFRPLLMTWWPSRKIQVDYLNYMAKQGYVSGDVDYTTNTSSAVLNDKVTEVQANIEAKLAKSSDTKWLKDLFSNFIKTEPIWNQDSESVDYGGLQLQGGFLRYDNSKLTPAANSDWRLIGRGPMNVFGNGPVQSEFLLANDIDNSNPVVQAEQLNWMHYLLNFGSITANDPDANFDGIRVDAVDNVDADLLQIAGDYFNAAYKSDQSDANANKHLNILEDWTWADAQYANSIGNPQLTMDQQLSASSAMRGALGKPDGQRTNIREMISKSLVNRTVDDTENVAIPNYSFWRAHDNGSQDEIQQAIAATTGKPYGVFNQAEEEAGMEAYIADQNSTVKKWNVYNVPAAYAYFLTNKDTVPRIYYGDLFTDGGQFMEHKTRYYDALTNLLKSRIKYVAGGQTVNVDSHDVLTSVRFGKGAMKVTDEGTTETRTQGIGVVINNNPKLNLGNDTVVLHMGAAHKNQTYRAALLTTDDGVLSFDSDKNAPIAKTDSNGDLHFYSNDLVVDGVLQANTGIHGVANPDVSGYLAVWVPVGASDNQDARTQASTATTNDGSTYHQNAALDSNVIFEAFSNFIYAPKQHSDAMNYKIARNAAFFKDLGITSMELPPQYNSSKDGSFLDSTIDNGYAFTDRYDLGMSQDNKYGSAQDLRDALKAIHAQGMQAMADWVPDQIYNLPGQELVTATRVNEYGQTWDSSSIKNDLYVANTIGGGQYQKQYGGAFLDELKTKYPEIFTRKQRSTGTTIDPSTKITEWSAKYFNGTNILKRGAGYVLRYDDNQYYTIDKDGNKFLPMTLDPNGSNKIGFREVNGSVYFYGDEGILKNQWKQDWSGNWYYFGQDGKMVTNGLTKLVVDGHEDEYYFMSNGVSFRNGLLTIDGHTYYFDENGRVVKNRQLTDGAVTYEIDEDGNVKSEVYNPASDQPHPLSPNDLAK